MLPSLLGVGCGVALAFGDMSPAEAIVYNSSATVPNFTYNNNGTQAGTIAGSFNYTGTAIDSLNLTVSPWLQAGGDLALTATYTGTATSLGNLTFTAGEEFFQINNILLTNTPNQVINLTSQASNSIRICLNRSCPGPQQINLSVIFSGGTLTSVPFGPSGFMLVPLSALFVCRKRFRKLVKASL
ncbi:MAG: hypothetical protein ACOVNL_03310 [Prochlorococcaceae cyanobacterium]